MSRTVEYFFSLASPWSFLGHASFMEVVRRHGAEVAYFPVNLGPVFAETGGLPLAKRAPPRQRYRMMELYRWRLKRAVDFHVSPQFWPFDPTLADCVVIAAIGRGSVETVLPRLYSAVWQRQENLGDAQEIVRILDELGLPGTEMVEEARSERIVSIYTGNRTRALEAGMFGAPSYVLDGEVFWGQDRIDLLDDALASGRAPFLGT